ncbi:LuxR C-terminal-related transcriptional regulator [Agrobacterium arsenijevicii]|uniref:LuxR C-terminal-related transcriptional regulator n=1 Tax=Agrobacterium arsenijevicii TaxID=1585697 RepID=UPI0033055DBB
MKIDRLPREVPSSKVDGVDLSILQLLTIGATQKEVGVRLELSPRTIEHRIDRLKGRVGAKSLQHMSFSGSRVGCSISAKMKMGRL